jgi:periplasmic divalent cation tolerance protein
MNVVRVVLCTVPPPAAQGIADALLAERLVACVNLLPQVTSRYLWQGRLEEAAETLLVMKTAAHLVERLRQRLVELHPYDVPEVLELAVDGGHAPYLQWVLDTCATDP